MTAVVEETISVKYDLFDLPTAQHKAGLAGLILQIRSMEERRFELESIPKIEQATPTSATIQFSRQSVQALFDDVYDARIAEVGVKSKWSKKPKREEFREIKDTKTAETKSVKYFIYDVTQPRGHFLRDKFADEDGLWLKLWRDMLWSIPRGISKTRIPYDQRAQDKQCKEGQDAWRDLVRAEKARGKNTFHTAEIAGSLWLGAQSLNAEQIPFQGRAEQNLVLHFWPLTVLIYVPQQIDADGKTDFAGFTIAVPEVANLEYFCEEYPQMLSELDTTRKRGYRPAAAVIDLPEQGALEFLDHLARLAAHKTNRKSDFVDSVNAVEFLHLVKIGNNIKLMAAGRIAPRPELLEKYEAIVGDGNQAPPYRNPLFRRGLMLSLLREQPWHENLLPLMMEMPWPFFIRSVESPQRIPGFWRDAAKKFQTEIDSYKHELEVHQDMKDTSNNIGKSPQPDLSVLIHRLIRNYILRRTEEKTGMTWNKIKEGKNSEGKVELPGDWREAREKVASDAFLAARSRRDKDFVDFFTSTFCYFKQYLPLENDFQIVAEALLKEPENLKTLTLLALSANS